MATSRTKVFFDIDIGEPSTFAKEKQEYERAQKFLEKMGPSYGLSQNIQDLDATSLETLQELYSTDTSWSAQGSIRVKPPTDLRAGKIILELYDELCPKTCENFRILCSGEMGHKKTANNKPLHYLGNKFHRIEKGFVCQAGDITRGDGSGGESIWNKKFNDEKEGLKIKFDKPGQLAMANSGKNSNSSQFFITFAPNSKLDGKYVAFGNIVGEESLQVLKKIEQVESKDGKPFVDVIIAGCGILK